MSYALDYPATRTDPAEYRPTRPFDCVRCVYTYDLEDDRWAEAQDRPEHAPVCEDCWLSCHECGEPIEHDIEALTQEPYIFDRVAYCAACFAANLCGWEG